MLFGCLSFVVCCLLLVVDCYIVFVFCMRVRASLLGVHCLLFVVVGCCWLLLVVGGWVFVVCRLMCWCLVFGAWRLLFLIRC